MSDHKVALYYHDKLEDVYQKAVLGARYGIWNRGILLDTEELDVDEPLIGGLDVKRWCRYYEHLFTILVVLIAYGSMHVLVSLAAREKW